MVAGLSPARHIRAIAAWISARFSSGVVGGGRFDMSGDGGLGGGDSAARV